LFEGLNEARGTWTFEGKYVVKLLARQTIVRQRVAVDDVADVLTLDQHVGLADGVGLAIEFLTVHHRPGIRVLTGKMILRNRAGP
jgi:hypothetical protein